MTAQNYTVKGMTCAHCVQAVTEEVSKVKGVIDVIVDLPSGSLTVASAAPLNADAVAEAVDEAGYELVRG